jgi:large exoprotein involved in heme utilization and adhesion
VDDQIQLLNTAEISTRTYATGKSGLINVSANNQITLSKGATIFSSTSNAGNAGKVNIKTQGELDISDNSLISSTTFSQGKAGDVTVQAGELLIDGKGTVAGISSASSSQDVDAGESGSIYVTTDSSVNLLNGAQIFNITETTANAGDINIETNALVIDGKGIYTGISNSTTSDSTHAGNAGNINILTDNKIEILEGGRILNDTFSMGKAGNIIIDSAKLLLDGKNIITGITSNTNSDYLNAGNAGTVTITASDQIEILNGAGVSSNTFSTGDAGSVSVEADEILIDANNENMFTGIASDAELSSTGNAGIVNVTSHGLLKVVNGATISSNTFSIGNAGEVRLIAQEIELVGGVTGIFTGISSSADIDSFGNAGTVDITALDSLDIMNGAAIASSTFSKGNAGDIRVKAGKVLLDGKNATMVTEISSSAEAGSSGDAGEVAIDVDNMLQIISGAAIASSTFSKGNAGSVKVQADEILIDGNKENMFTGIVSNAEVSSTGNAGTLTLKANKIRLIGEGTSLLSGISSSADIDTFGNAGTVDITAIDSLELTNGAAILSSAWSKGNAGDIRVKAGRVLLDGKDATMATTISSSAEASSSGDAGRIDINVANELKVLSGATIGSSTFSKGNAGGVRVQAGDILLDGKDATIATVISSSAESGSSGDAGTVRVNVANALKIFSGAAISSSTWASGDAGEIKINAENIIIDDKNSPYWKTGIGSVALADATGLVGNININTNNLQIFNGGLISISHYGNIADTYLSNSQIGSLSINAHTIDLYNKSQISALATGNAPASSIDIHVSDTLSLKGSSGISTQANTNNGGPINILSANSIILNNSLITTSTDQGDGGNINIDSDLLVMDTGFIQANTAQGASGGDIAMEIKYLITKKSISPEVGGDRQEEFMSNSGRNIIQAAAPQGNPGNLHVNIPDIDIASSLVKLSTHYIKEVDLIKNPCSSNTLDSSSLVEVGKGGVPIEPKDSVNIFFGADRLENLMNN